MPESNSIIEPTRPVETVAQETALSTPEAGTTEAVFFAELEEQVTTEINHLTAKADEFIAMIDVATPEGQSAQAAMEAIKAEAAEVTATFWERLAEIVGHPIKTYKEYRQNKRETELARPDNPEVIKELKEKFGEILSAMFHYDNKFRDRKLKGKTKIGESLHYDEKILKNFDTLLSELNLATKTDKTKWSDVESNVNEIIIKLIKSELVPNFLPILRDLKDKKLISPKIDKLWIETFLKQRSREEIGNLITNHVDLIPANLRGHVAYELLLHEDSQEDFIKYLNDIAADGHIDAVIDLLIENNRPGVASTLLRHAKVRLTPEQRAKIWDKAMPVEYRKSRIQSVYGLSNYIPDDRQDSELSFSNVTESINMLIDKGPYYNLTGLLYHVPITPEQRVQILDEIITKHNTDEISHLIGVLRKEPFFLDDHEKKILFEEIISGRMYTHIYILISERTRFDTPETIAQAGFSVLSEAAKAGSGNVAIDLMHLLSRNKEQTTVAIEPDRRRACLDNIIEGGKDLGSLFKHYASRLKKKENPVEENPFDLTGEQVNQLFEAVIKRRDIAVAGEIIISSVKHNSEDQEQLHRPTPDQEKTLVENALEYAMQQASSNLLSDIIKYNPDILEEKLKSYFEATNYAMRAIRILIDPAIDLKKIKAEPIIERFYRENLATCDMDDLDALLKFDESLFNKILDGKMQEYHDTSRTEIAVSLAHRSLKIGVRVDAKYAPWLMKGLSSTELPTRDKQVSFGGLCKLLFESENYDSFAKKLSPENDTPISRETWRYCQEFSKKYSAGGKGKTIMTLLATREYTDTVPVETVIQKFAKELRAYEKILETYAPDAIPDGIQTSIGMEYEITNSTGIGYTDQNDQNHKRSLKSDILNLSAVAGVGQGRDALHEIATKPTDNPYAMLLEMKLLQDLGFFDLNFETPGYEKGARGYHLTIGGKTGLSINKDTNFLQNTLLASGWGGVNSGKNVDRLARSRSNIRQRGSDEHNIAVFEKMTPSVELRALSIDRWEPFERSIVTAYNGAIAIQAMEKYKSKFKAAPDAKTKAIISEWKRLVDAVTNSVKDHNENFLTNETAGYLNDADEWIEPTDWGGAENEERFKSVVHSIDPRKSVSDYSAGLTLSIEDFFKETSPELANRATQINNLFLKPATVMGGDRANAFAMLEATKLGNGRPETSPHRALTDSIFDKKGKERLGYYSIQGASEKMITHAIQRHLLEFNHRMKEILTAPATAETAAEKPELKLAA